MDTLSLDDCLICHGTGRDDDGYPCAFHGEWFEPMIFDPFNMEIMYPVRASLERVMFQTVGSDSELDLADAVVDIFDTLYEMFERYPY